MRCEVALKAARTRAEFEEQEMEFGDCDEDTEWGELTDDDADADCILRGVGLSLL